MKSKKILILGFGGHARSVADIALSCGYEDILFIDANARNGENFLGFDVINDYDRKFDNNWAAFPGSGDAYTREKQCIVIESLKLPLVTLISPDATIGHGALVGAGSLICRHAHIGPMANVGISSIINSGAVVDHEVVIGDFSHVSINATMAGRSRLGSYSMLGAGAVIIDKVIVGDRVIIGAGSVVLRNIDVKGTYVGVPAHMNPARIQV